MLCDYRTTTPEELVAGDLVSPHYEGEQYWVRHNPKHQYYYFKDMTTEDVMVIKCFDSAAEANPFIAKCLFCDHIMCSCFLTSEQILHIRLSRISTMYRMPDLERALRFEH